jgi:hypothetical protein
VALDSTPAGQPLYASLGFADEIELERWRGPIPWERGLPARFDRSGQDGRAPRGTAPRPMEPADLAAVAAHDARLFGTDRGRVLGALYQGHPDGCFVAEHDGEIVGYVLGRPGARAWHLGPLAADDPATAESLARAALRLGSLEAAHGGGAQANSGAQAGSGAFAREAFSEVVMDVVRPNGAALRLAEALGLAPVRRFIRMTRGAPPPSVDTARLYTSAGPELG